MPVVAHLQSSFAFPIRMLIIRLLKIMVPNLNITYSRMGSSRLIFYRLEFPDYVYDEASRSRNAAGRSLGNVARFASQE